MAVFESTLGHSGANSYLSAAEADDIFQATMRESAWSALTQAEKEAALMAATGELETLDYAGTRCDPSTDDAGQPQALQWPRSDATCKGVEATCAAIPLQVRKTAAHLALELHLSPPPVGTGPSGSGTGSVQKQKLGDLEISYYDSGGYGGSGPALFQKYPWTAETLGCWSASATGSSGIRYRVRS